MCAKNLLVWGNPWGSVVIFSKTFFVISSKRTANLSQKTVGYPSKKGVHYIFFGCLRFDLRRLKNAQKRQISEVRSTFLQRQLKGGVCYIPRAWPFYAFLRVLTRCQVFYIFFGHFELLWGIIFDVQKNLMHPFSGGIPNGFLPQISSTFGWNKK